MAELTATHRLPVVAPEDEGPLPAHVVSHASGGRDLWAPPLDERPAEPDQALLELLMEVLDPELPISLVDLGLIYGARLDGEDVAHIELTFTATACPCMEFIREDIRDRLMQEHWIRQVEIRDVWDPPWSREMISERGREQLRRLGVAG